MGRPKKQKHVQMVVAEFVNPNTKNKDRTPNREIELAASQMRSEMSEAMRLFRRQQKLPHLYNNSEK